MKTTVTTRAVEEKAANALSSLFEQMSAIKSWKIKFRSGGRNRADILADFDVYGRNHKLLCRVADGEPGDVRKVLDKLCTGVNSGPSDATPVLIAPYLSSQTRAMCEQSRVSFIDLEGNAHLEVDEVFIGKRSCRSAIADVAAQKLLA